MLFLKTMLEIIIGYWTFAGPIGIPFFILGALFISDGLPRLKTNLDTQNKRLLLFGFFPLFAHVIVLLMMTFFYIVGTKNDNIVILSLNVLFTGLTGSVLYIVFAKEHRIFATGLLLFFLPFTLPMVVVAPFVILNIYI